MFVNEQIAILEALKKSYARRNLIDFTMYCNPRYVPNWHHYVIADRLEMLSRGEILRLMICAPPRHGKSELVSINLPAWHFGNNPYHNIIAASLDSKLAERSGKRARNIVASVEFRSVFKHAKLSEESAAKLVWTLEESLENKPCPACGNINWYKKAFGRAICRSCGNLGEFAGSNTIGEYFGTGMHGGIVGRGAHLFIIDDPFQGRAQAKSVSNRDNVWDWYLSEALGRLQKQARICLINTRWHEDDLSGRILKKHHGKTGDWTVLVLKAIAEADEEWEIYNPDYIEVLGTNILRRKKGEALWPSEYPLNVLMNKKAESSFEFESQYQGNPHPPEGSLFKRNDFRYGSKEDNYYTLLDGNSSRRVSLSKCIRFVTGDLGYIEGDDNAYTVFCTWDLDPATSDLILIDMYRKQIDGAYHMDVLWNIYHKNNPQEIAIESVGYQIALVQKAILDGLPAKKLEAKGDKEFRALTAAAKMESHKIFLLNSLPELDVIENELSEFPNGTYKDIVDNFAYAAIRAATIKKVLFAAPPPPERNDYSITNRRKVLENL